MVFEITVKAAPFCWLVKTIIPNFTSGIIMVCVTMPSKPPVCETCKWPLMSSKRQPKP